MSRSCSTGIMTEKITIDELIVRVMPGGFLLGVILFIFGNEIQLKLVKDLDFLYTFLFFCSAFILGELLQTLAHEIEWITDTFFKFRRPSKVFLYKNNPVLNNEKIRNELFEMLKLPAEEASIFNKEYSELSILWWKRKKIEDELSQGIFWKLYSKVSRIDEVKNSNRNYLFARVIIVDFILIGTIFFFYSYIYVGIISIFISILFLWRSRGVARGLVFKSVLLNLNND